jgi:hypothetical protein
VPQGFTETLSEESVKHRDNREKAISTFTNLLNNIRPSWNDTGFILKKNASALIYDIGLDENYDITQFHYRISRLRTEKEMTYGEASRAMTEKSQNKQLQIVHDFALHQYNKTYHQNCSRIGFNTVNSIMTEAIQMEMSKVAWDQGIGCIGQFKNQKTHVTTLLPVENDNGFVVPGTASRRGKHCINIMSAKFFDDNNDNMFPLPVLTSIANYYQYVA